VKRPKVYRLIKEINGFEVWARPRMADKINACENARQLIEKYENQVWLEAKPEVKQMFPNLGL
jgi:hypothetical protein